MSSSMTKIFKQFPLDVQREFESLALALSPENLYEDGEISEHLAQQKKKKLDAEWKKLEARVGQKVSETEIWERYDQRMK